MAVIKVDENDPVGELEPSFPYRDVKIMYNVDVRDYYDLMEEIGRGKFGTVYRCQEKKTGTTLAAKFVKIAKKQDRRNVEREVEIMRQLQHPRLIQLYDSFEMQNVMVVVLELIEGGELFERVIDDDFILTEKSCTVFMRQICEGVDFIHTNNIIHLDLKPENILCLTKTGNRIKIIDFGLARKYESDKKLQVLFGTPEFVAPEVVNFDEITTATDMWSVGVICYVLLSGLSPFMGETDLQTMTNVTLAQYDFDDEAFETISPEAKDFISKLLVKDKDGRISAGECLNHPWLRRQPPPPPPLTLDVSKDNLKTYVEVNSSSSNTLLLADSMLNGHIETPVLGMALEEPPKYILQLSPPSDSPKISNEVQSVKAPLTVAPIQSIEPATSELLLETDPGIVQSTILTPSKVIQPIALGPSDSLIVTPNELTAQLTMAPDTERDTQPMTVTQPHIIAVADKTANYQPVVPVIKPINQTWALPRSTQASQPPVSQTTNQESMQPGYPPTLSKLTQPNQSQDVTPNTEINFATDAISKTFISQPRITPIPVIQPPILSPIHQVPVAVLTKPLFEQPNIPPTPFIQAPVSSSIHETPTEAVNKPHFDQPSMPLGPGIELKSPSTIQEVLQPPCQLIKQPTFRTTVATVFKGTNSFLDGSVAQTTTPTNGESAVPSVMQPFKSNQAITKSVQELASNQTVRQANLILDDNVKVENNRENMINPPLTFNSKSSDSELWECNNKKPIIESPDRPKNAFKPDSIKFPSSIVSSIQLKDKTEINKSNSNQLNIKFGEERIVQPYSLHDKGSTIRDKVELPSIKSESSYVRPHFLSNSSRQASSDNLLLAGNFGSVFSEKSSSLTTSTSISNIGPKPFSKLPNKDTSESYIYRTKNDNKSPCKVSMDSSTGVKCKVSYSNEKATESNSVRQVQTTSSEQERQLSHIKLSPFNPSLSEKIKPSVNDSTSSITQRKFETFNQVPEKPFSRFGSLNKVLKHQDSAFVSREEDKPKNELIHKDKNQYKAFEGSLTTDYKSWPSEKHAWSGLNNVEMKKHSLETTTQASYYFARSINERYLSRERQNENNAQISNQMLWSRSSSTKSSENNVTGKEAASYSGIRRQKFRISEEHSRDVPLSALPRFSKDKINNSSTEVNKHTNLPAFNMLSTKCVTASTTEQKSKLTSIPNKSPPSPQKSV